MQKMAHSEEDCTINCVHVFSLKKKKPNPKHSNPVTFPSLAEKHQNRDTEPVSQ